MSQAAEDRADLELFLDEARRFVHNRLQPAVSRHETLISPPLLADITREATNLGLLSLPPAMVFGSNRSRLPTRFSAWLF